LFREALFHLSQERHLRDLATQNGLARKMAYRFVAGETLSEALDAVAEINRHDMTATLDHLGENVGSKEEADQATNDACHMLQEIARLGVDSNVSLKLTQLGLDLGDELALDNMRRVLEEAARHENFIRIDMEGSNYVERTLDLFYRLFEEYKNVGAVIQAYLYRSASDVEHLNQVGARVRLVKGAYLEPETVAYQSKAEVDANFVKLTEMLLGGGNYPAIATHDPNMIDAAKRFARQHDIEQTRFEFQMLYGVRRDLQSRLRQEGFNMRVYVPYGTHWYPYLMRRMAERPANVMFVLGNIGREAVANRR
jgi:proline dehydrogenase